MNKIKRKICPSCGSKRTTWNKSYMEEIRWCRDCRIEYNDRTGLIVKI